MSSTTTVCHHISKYETCDECDVERYQEYLELYSSHIEETIEHDIDYDQLIDEQLAAEGYEDEDAVYRRDLISSSCTGDQYDDWNTAADLSNALSMSSEGHLDDICDCLEELLMYDCAICWPHGYISTDPVVYCSCIYGLVFSGRNQEAVDTLHERYLWTGCKYDNNGGMDEFNRLEWLSILPFSCSTEDA